MIPAAYLDTSAFLRLFLEEPESERVVAVLRDTGELFALRLVLTEARVTLARLHRDGRLDRGQYLGTLDAVGLYWESEIQMVDATEEHFRSAEYLAEIQPGLRTLDALHVGTARLLGRARHPGPVAFIGCDRRLLKAAAAIGLETPIPPAS